MELIQNPGLHDFFDRICTEIPNLWLPALSGNYHVEIFDDNYEFSYFNNHQCIWSLSFYHCCDRDFHAIPPYWVLHWDGFPGKQKIGASLKEVLTEDFLINFSVTRSRQVA